MALDFDFNRIKDDLFTAGKNAEEKFNDTTAAARIRLEARSKEDFLNKQYAALGRAYYEAHKDTPELVPEAELFAAISAAEKELEELQDTVMNKAGFVICPVCGERQKKSAAFCSACGSALH